MIKKISVIILLLIAHFELSAQVDSFNYLVNEWKQGKVYPNGKVGQAEVNRGGLYYLDIYPNNLVTFKDPFSCGFGRRRDGNWILNKDDSTITFNFTETTGYMNNRGTQEINEQEVYRIEKLTEDELIISLLGSEEKVLYLFIPAEQKENILFINWPTKRWKYK